MISALTGELRGVDEDRAHVQVGAMLFTLLIPASDVPSLREAVGREMTFHTILYLEGDSSGGNLEPRLVGFVRPEDRSFFELFITVKGIGPKKALRALTLPAGEIALAIESRDTRFLCQLPQIGKRLAEQIVAELAGKTGRFATSTRSGLSTPAKRSEVEEDAIATLIQLGERRGDAERLLDTVRRSHPELTQSDELAREMLRARGLRA